MITVRYGWEFKPQRPENAHKAGSGERELTFSTEARAVELFDQWHREAPSWSYWLISSRPATKTEITKAARFRLTRT
jgi:hypothetical protein